jgi:hypothetical protein
VLLLLLCLMHNSSALLPCIVARLPLHSSLLLLLLLCSCVLLRCELLLWHIINVWH